MEQPLFRPDEGASLEEVKALLSASCDFEAEMEYIEPFTEEEKISEDVRLSESTQLLHDKQDEIKKTLEPLKKEKTDLENQQKEIRNLLKQGGYKRLGEVFALIESNNRMVQIYTPNGKLIERRALSVSERQRRLRFD